MSRLLLVRHGEPEAAWGGTEPDPGLSAEGRMQAEATAQVLCEQGALATLTSPMRRCRETAAPYETMSGSAALIEPNVSEVATPTGVADRRAWLAENFPWRGGTPVSWSSRPAELRAWRQDVLAWANALRQDCVVFSHFIAINVLVGAALGRDETIVCAPNYASITELAVDHGVLSLVQLGETMQAGEVR